MSFNLTFDSHTIFVCLFVLSGYIFTRMRFLNFDNRELHQLDFLNSSQSEQTCAETKLIPSAGGTVLSTGVTVLGLVLPLCTVRMESLSSLAHTVFLKQVGVRSPCKTTLIMQMNVDQASVRLRMCACALACVVVELHSQSSYYQFQLFLCVCQSAADTWVESVWAKPRN